MLSLNACRYNFYDKQLNIIDLKNYFFIYGLMVLNMLMSGCISDNQSFESFNIYDGYYSEKLLILDELNRIELDLQDHMVSSFFVTPENEVYLFDRSYGMIYKMDENGHIESKTGGIGRGPGEFITENVLTLTYCGTDIFFAFDWSQPRIQVYDLDLNLLNPIILNSVPYDVSCVNDRKLAVLYAYMPKIDIISYEGVLHEELVPDVLFGESKESVFRHFNYINQNIYALSYYFKPELLLVHKKEQSQKEIVLSKLEFQDVHFAVRKASVVGDELHLFYMNINRDLPEPEYKVTHVFHKNDGEYLYSYRMPERISQLQFISDHRIATLEDSLRTVALYDFKIEDNE